MDDLLDQLFQGKETVTIKEIAAYFRITTLTIKRRMWVLGYEKYPSEGWNGPRRLTREQVSRLFPQQ